MLCLSFACYISTGSLGSLCWRVAACVNLILEFDSEITEACSDNDILLTGQRGTLFTLYGLGHLGLLRNENDMIMNVQALVVPTWQW